MDRIGKLSAERFQDLADWVQTFNFSAVLAQITEKRYQYVRNLQEQEPEGWKTRPFALTLEVLGSDHFLFVRTHTSTWSLQGLADGLRHDSSRDVEILGPDQVVGLGSANPKLWVPTHILARKAFKLKGLNYMPKPKQKDVTKR